MRAARKSIEKHRSTLVFRPIDLVICHAARLITRQGSGGGLGRVGFKGLRIEGSKLKVGKVGKKIGQPVRRKTVRQLAYRDVMRKGVGNAGGYTDCELSLPTRV